MSRKFIARWKKCHSISCIIQIWQTFASKIFFFRLFKNQMVGDQLCCHQELLLSNAWNLKADFQLLLNSGQKCTGCPFKGKGVLRDGLQLLDKKAFPSKYFSEFWHWVVDMKVMTFISWSLKKYRVKEGHNLLATTFQGKLSFTFIKLALGDAS